MFTGRFSRELFDIGKISPTVKFGGITLINCHYLVVIDNEFRLQYLSPEEIGAPFRLSEASTGSSENLTLIINNNEWFAMTDNWDIITAGRKWQRETKENNRMRDFLRIRLWLAIE